MDALPDDFFRISRNCAVNLKNVRSFSPAKNWKLN
ncbi:MAG: LytTR family transcriptional regulator DNA-binding domain-containing protein [Dysgonamonadaceae bacterium]|nr:LytTR family transcriptional regulator DNA-binding domain-containing protein [Dysgonamonadaceae bacterium]